MQKKSRYSPCPRSQITFSAVYNRYVCSDGNCQWLVSREAIACLNRRKKCLESHQQQVDQSKSRFILSQLEFSASRPRGLVLGLGVTSSRDGRQIALIEGRSARLMKTLRVDWLALACIVVSRTLAGPHIWLAISVSNPRALRYYLKYFLPRRRFFLSLSPCRSSLLSLLDFLRVVLRFTRSGPYRCEWVSE